MRGVDLRELDFFMISYDEPGADARFNELKLALPGLQRVHGVHGEFNAWQEAARRAKTSHFAKIDADTRLKPGFSFQVQGLQPGDRRVHVWRSQNPVNGLVYGHGSIHLFSRAHILESPPPETVDPTMGVATEGFHIQEECATINCFNSSPFETWRAAFRECARLAGGLNAFVGTQPERRSTESKLHVWTSLGMHAENGIYSILGARMGALHGFSIARGATREDTLRSREWCRSLWETAVADRDPSVLVIETGRELRSKYDFTAEDFSSVQSRWLVELWYGTAVDALKRLAIGAGIPPALNY